MSHSWDDTYDVVVVGGDQGFDAARTAAAGGLDVVVLIGDEPVPDDGDPGPQFWPRTVLRSLLVDDDGGIAGVLIDHNGATVRLRARAGVLLTAGLNVAGAEPPTTILTTTGEQR